MSQTKWPVSTEQSRSESSVDPDDNFRRVDNSHATAAYVHEIQRRWKWRGNLVEILRPRIFVTLVVILYLSSHPHHRLPIAIGYALLFVTGLLSAFLIGRCPACRYPLYGWSESVELGPISWFPTVSGPVGSKCAGCGIELY